ncbi:MAG: hypothetical protein RMN52_01090 [Anaerolineae bacterium]|nr:hypothetical protein [Candidatus Roseilinea sp.]MDW8448573.1 hypothetical protein [Anaerolineae bacterium]
MKRQPSQAFSNLLNAYAKAINLAYHRTGSLFQHPFGRIAVTDERYLSHLVVYIHRNPQRHGLIADFRDWPYSSYATLLSNKPTRLRRDDCLAWFGDRSWFERVHLERDDVGVIAPLLGEDFD